MTADAGFAELYRSHYRRVYGLCRQLLGSADGAQDAAQEVFIRAHRSLPSDDVVFRSVRRESMIGTPD